MMKNLLSKNTKCGLFFLLLLFLLFSISTNFVQAAHAFGKKKEEPKVKKLEEADKLPSLLRIGVVDMDFVLQNSEFIRESVDTVERSRIRVERLIKTADEEIAELQTQGDPGRLVQRKAEIQKILDKEVIGFHNEEIDIQKAIKSTLKSKMAAAAKKFSLDVLVDTRVMPFGGKNVTIEFMELLENSSLK